jgi:hypothetical protein
VDPTLGATGDQPPDGPPHGAVARPALLRLPAGRDNGRFLARLIACHRTALSLACVILVLALLTTIGLSAGRGNAVSYGAVGTGAAAAAAAAAAKTAAAKKQRGEAANLSALAAVRRLEHTAALPAATAPPAPAPPSLAGAPPLSPHQVFGFAPYWTLAQSDGFNVAEISTLAYFAVGVNPDGTLVQSGPGWNGYESQALADLVTRAHAAGDRVVLTVNNFDQGQLDALTSSPTAAATLAGALVSAIAAKNLDGVNLDFEGQGSADQVGLTHLVTTVSSALKAANPHYQVTMDTYSSSASGSNGWFNLPALAPAVDAFFVMEYNPNLSGTQSATSPLTSGMFSDDAALKEYVAVLPPSKIILGLPYFGIDWPTTGGTLTATATGPATTISLGDIAAAGNPVFWDATTDSGWTSYQVGTQWHETFFEDPSSLYDAAKMAQFCGLEGVGIWALGMDGNNAGDLAALLGFAPAVKSGPAGPASTSVSPPATTSPVPTTTSPTAPTSLPTPVPAPPPTGTTTTTTTSPPVTTTTTTTPPHTYSGLLNGVRSNLTEVSSPWIPTVSGPVPTGLLYGFTTNDPAAACLAAEPSLQVWAVSGNVNEFLVAAAKPRDCLNADFILSTT